MLLGLHGISAATFGILILLSALVVVLDAGSWQVHVAWRDIQRGRSLQRPTSPTSGS